MIPWIAFAALAALAGAALALPLRRTRKTASGRAAYDLAVFRRQLADLESDRARGHIAAGEARAARLEIERRILAADAAAQRENAADAPDPQPDRGRASALAAAAIGVPLMSLAIYALTGAPGTPDRPLAERAATAAAMPADVAEAIAGLAERLRENPGNLEGWLLLGRSYAATARYREAAEALASAAALAPDDAGIAAAVGEALFYAAGGAVTPAAARQFDTALALDPAHPGARYYRGLAAAQAGDPAAAVAAWTALAEDAAPDAPWLPELRERLRAAAAELGVPPPAVATAPANTALPPAPGDSEFAAAAAAMADMAPAERQAAVEGMVARLEARLEGAPDDPEGWRRLARAKQTLGDTEAARRAWRRAIDLAPDHIPALAALAALERALAPPGQPLPEPALALYRRLIALDPEQLEALWFLGLAAADAGRRGEAARLWDRLLARLPPGGEPHALVAARLAELRENAPLAPRGGSSGLSPDSPEPEN